MQIGILREEFGDTIHSGEIIFDFFFLSLFFFNKRTVEWNCWLIDCN